MDLDTAADLAEDKDVRAYWRQLAVGIREDLLTEPVAGGVRALVAVERLPPKLHC